MKILLITLFALYFSFSTLHAQYQITNYTTYNTGSCSLGANTIFEIEENPATNEIYFRTNNDIIKYDNNSFYPVISDLDYPSVFDVIAHVFNFDINGNLWFDGYFNLSCYDGNSIATYPYILALGDNSAILCDSQNNIWFATNNGLTMFDGTNTTEYSTANFLLDNMVYCLFEDSQGNIWVGTNGGINMFNGVSWKSYSAQSGLIWPSNNSYVYAIEEDKNGTIWCGGNKIAYLTGETWNVLNPTVILNNNINYDAINSITCEPTGKLWFASVGLFYKDNNTWGSYSETDGLATNNVRDIYADSQNRLWVGLESRGLSVLENGIWTNYNTSDGLAENFVTDIFEDTTNTIFFCTEHGLSNMQNNNWTSYFTDFTYGVVSEIHYDFNKYLVVWGEGGYIYRNINNSWQIIPNYVANGAYDYISTGTDEYWFAGYAGITHFWPPIYLTSNWVTYSQNQGLPDSYCFTIEKDSSDIIWAGTLNGIAYFTGNGFQQVIPPSDDFGNIINDIRIDLEENIWFASNYGVAKYNGTLWEFYFNTDGLIDNFVRDIEIASDSSIWFATKKGVSILSDSGFISITKADGLIYDGTHCIEQDHEGNIWVGTLHGVSKIHDAVLIPPNSISENIIASKSISIFPNPATNQIQISSKELINTIEIYNMAGCLVQKMQCNNKQQISDSYRIDVSSLQAGSYFVRASRKNGVWVEKVVVISF